jgi:hypothetical protein
MGASAFAAGPYTITIKKKDTSDKSVHKYEVFQILKGESTDAGQLHSIDWGDHVNVSDESAVLAALSGATVLNTTCSNVEDVVEALKDLESNSAPLDNFASAISDFLKTTSLTATLAANASSTTVSVTEPGYYMVKDTITDNDNPSAVSKFMLKIVSNTNIDICKMNENSKTEININSNDNIKVGKFFTNHNYGYRCSCTKTNCKRKYCECYNSGRYCIDCDCKNCQNQKPTNAYTNKHPGNKSEMKKSREICTCSKSGCNKNYCECFKSGNKCSLLCRCIGCENIEDNAQINNKRFQFCHVNSIYIVNNRI